MADTELIALTEQDQKFIDQYARTGDIGFSSASVGYRSWKHGYEMLRLPCVQEELLRRKIDKRTHKEETYRNLILVANAALREMADVLKNPSSELSEKEMAIEGAGRSLNRVAMIEGLIVSTKELEGSGRPMSLQAIADLIEQRDSKLKLEPMKIIDAQPPANGNGTNGKAVS